MDNYKTNFLDYPLDRDVHVCRPYVFEKRPIKILVTDGGHKFVFCLLYKICSGEVFGNDQDVIIHLICSKGVIDQKSIFYELEECGFHLLKGWLVTSDIEEAYTDVDIVVFTTSYEEQSGVTHKETLLNHIIKARQTTKYVLTYAKSDVKIIFVGASTKFVLLEMGLLRRLEPTLKYRNVSGVTLLDEAIARAHLAAKLKTTTDRIKNIIIWGQTCPDVHYATVRMLPKGDLGATEEVEVPVHEALQDDRYLHETFIELGIFLVHSQEESRVRTFQERKRGGNSNSETSQGLVRGTGRRDHFDGSDNAALRAVQYDREYRVVVSRMVEGERYLESQRGGVFG
ncbi:UNVERIFIED_CONTAM: hypothetical protein PYX00_000185 [Menopon gallinae]|uniref:Lactate/malate dehydrogenase N-terminal domain-containing protein n=1 Tax=Menopon gallinae TaxID=328185 RepID=A0AAW2I8B5_9NEOP